MPSIYAALSNGEWLVLERWFRETEQEQLAGEINVPAMCLIQGLVSGGAIRRIVQLGHYSGYSSLLLGFMLRRMNTRPGLFSIDIDRSVTEFTSRWINLAGLTEHVTLHVGDSADPGSVRAARETLGAQPQLILLDSSHQYSHTLSELDEWVPQLPVGGLLLLHDTSVFAERWDPTGDGGVHRALVEWLPSHPEVAAINLNGFVGAGVAGDSLVYKDACGLALIQRVDGRARADQSAAASA